MSKDDIPTFDFDSDAEPAPRLVKLQQERTETIDLTTLYPSNLSVSGSFDFGRVESTSLGKLLHALPIPAMVVDRSCTVIFSNEACLRIAPQHNTLEGFAFVELFPHIGQATEATSVLETVFATRKPRIIQASLGVNQSRIVGRVNFRSVRFGPDRSVLLLIEDLTVEKRQLLIIKRHAEKLQEGQIKLEARVEERTREIVKANELLKKEIMDRRRAQSSLSLAANVIRSSNEAIIITDADAKIVDVNEAFCQVTGYTRAELQGKDPKIMQSGRHDAAFWKKVWKTLAEKSHWKGEIWDRRKNGEIFPKLLSISAVADPLGRVNHYVGIFSDISKIKQTEMNLERLAHFDPLTGLANRVLFRDRLRQALLKAERTGEKVAVLFLDLDGFKHINDTLGHPVGDKLLNAVGKRLLDCVRKSDTVARLGGDEFTLVVTGFAETRNIDFLSRKIIDRLAVPFILPDRKIFVTASIGISIYPGDGHSVDLLLQNADTAMYWAKEKGKNEVTYFSREMNIEAAQRLDLETALREGLRREEFVVYYQPQVDLPTDSVCGCEALVRWNHPKQGIVAPAGFIGLAEKTGLIRPLGEWVMKKACEQVGAWQRQGLPPLQVAVNLSGHQLNSGEIVETVSRIIAETGIEEGLLDLEITESVLMGTAEESERILTDLKGVGVQLSIDDFGTGYSSLSYLKRFPVDKLKIDKSFILSLPADSDDAAIVKAIIGVGHSMGIKVMAEGVETKDQLDFLKSLGCDMVQGYYYSRPIPADLFATLFRSGFKQ